MPDSRTQTILNRISELSSKSRGKWLAAFFLITLAGIFVAALAHVKLDTLFSYGYRHDVFIYDQALQETLRGNFGVEYTYGNMFGDHALVILLLLLPVKIILAENMVPFFVLLAPVFHGIGVLTVFFTLRGITKDNLFPFLASLAILFSFACLRGIHEFLYGCHIDTISGYAAIVFASFLMLRNRNPNRSTDVVFWCAFLFFISLKEEMALLGAIFFLVAAIFQKIRLHIAGLIVACAAFTGQIVLIRYCETEWNRTNVRLLEQFIGSFGDGSFMKFLFYPGSLQFWVALGVSSVLFITVFGFEKTRNIPALCLFAIGWIKMLFGIVILDVNITTWHNFPAVTMMTAAILFQLAEVFQNDSARKAYLVLGILLSVSLYSFGAIEIPYWLAARSYPHQRITLAQKIERQRSLAEIKQRIEPKGVVSISGYSAIDFVDGHRYTFFPRGLSQPPKGIADYVVYDSVSPMDVSKIGREFEKEFENAHFILFRRRAITPESSEDRKRFTDIFGPDAIGAMTFETLGD